MYRRVIVALLILALLVSPTLAKETTKHHLNNTSTTLQLEIKKLKQEINILKQKLSEVEARNTQLVVENEKLRNEVEQLQEWNAKVIMDKMLMYRVTPNGKKYDLMFHEGGLGGVAVYQYVGPWLGDAGKWRQYKQIAELKTSQLKGGYIKPGVVIKPIWGFNKSTIRITSISQLIQLEKEVSGVRGLAKFYKWMFENYLKSSHYNTLGIAGAGFVALFVGLILGEVTQPIRGIADRITVSVMTDFEGKEGMDRFTLACILLNVIVFILAFSYGGMGSAILILVMISIVEYLLKKIVKR